MEHVLILGGGLAGRAAATAAAAGRKSFRRGADELSVELVARESFCTVLARNYQGELRPMRLALTDLLRHSKCVVVVRKLRALMSRSG